MNSDPAFRMWVKDLFVECSLDMRDETQRKRGGFAMSDACRSRATSVVESEGSFLYRCEKHRGVVSQVTGPVQETVPRRVE